VSGSEHNSGGDQGAATEGVAVNEKRRLPWEPTT